MPEQPDWETHGLDDHPDGLHKQDYLKDIRQFYWDSAELFWDKPKFYAPILKFFIDESLEAVQ
jgi:hypothetical protein